MALDDVKAGIMTAEEFRAIIREELGEQFHDHLPRHFGPIHDRLDGIKDDIRALTRKVEDLNAEFRRTTR